MGLGAAAGVGVAMAAPVALGMIGFTKNGIARKSIAASAMSSSAIATGTYSP